jgi:hypothetical protein
MKTIVTIIFFGLYAICFGQKTATLKDGTAIIIYPNKTWKYEYEIKAINIDSNSIIVDLKNNIFNEVWVHPLSYYSIELKTFQKKNVELFGYSNGYFLIKSTTGQIGYVNTLCVDNYSEYIKLIENKIIQKAKSKKKNIIIKGIGVDEINSADGVSYFIDWGYFDYSKSIKYISFTVVPYNNVGEIQTCRISGKSAATGRITGPISASDSFTYGLGKWDDAWYNSTITWIKLTKVVVQYIDGSSYTYVKEIPNILENNYVNYEK